MPVIPQREHVQVRQAVPEVRPEPVAVRSPELRATAPPMPPSVTVIVLFLTNSGMLWLLP